MRFGFALTLPLFIFQVFVLGFFSVEGAERLLLSREPVLLELRLGHAVPTVQEFLIFLQHFSPVSRVIYRTREQQLLAMQSMFPDTHFSETRDVPFRDALLVHVRTLQGYRSLLGALMVEPKWQEIVSPSALVRIGEQVQKMQSVGTALRFLRVGFLGVFLILSGVLFLSLLHRACRALSAHEDNGMLQEYLGAKPFLILWPVMYRLTAAIFFGILLSLSIVLVVILGMQTRGILFSQILFPLLYHRGWWILLSEGVMAVLLSLGGVLFWNYATCLRLRCDHSPRH